MSNYVRKIIVVGENGNGKSLTCNTLLGKEIFDGSRRSRTAGCETCYLHTRSVKLWVVDSPGMFEPVSVLAERALEIQNAVKECKDPHAFLIVFKADSRTDERNTNTIEMLRLIFGEVFFKHAIVVVTNAAKFKSDADFQSYRKQGKMSQIVDLCQGRIVRLENKDVTPQKKREMIDKVFALVDNVSRMGNFCYENKELHCHREMLEYHLKHVAANMPVNNQIEEMKRCLRENLQENGSDSGYYEVAKRH
ncbi:GTPase IMAP family member 9-like [Mercenaria mercenaria]|uniref:GTPase IMAP family member 9-like n=1 Tax=Mercenaria mercenaria TaxID=6596 RepID=UPI001E1E1E9C|nr:GTPase IMAP family member 9-like [Mercenaria mercenaria]